MTFEIPELIEEPGTWLGPDLQTAESWIYQLTAEDIAEIDAALAEVKGNSLEVPFLANQFPLPKFADRIDCFLEEIENGLGMVLLRGLPRERYSDDECAKFIGALAAIWAILFRRILVAIDWAMCEMKVNPMMTQRPEAIKQAKKWIST